ncbi:MAG: hemolysin family protein [Candidatus Melainabacteria bacterium]|nr:hemolysin family protein [Candidatus Melainabacteria bacterium]
MIFSLVLAALLITVNAFYVAAEFATVAARVAQIRKLAHDGNKLAKALLKVIEHPRELDQYIATCQIGITFASLVNGACTQATLGPSVAAFLVEHFHVDEAIAISASVFLILTVLTLTQILFGELLPKAVALQFSSRIALFMYWPLTISARVFKPFIWILNGSGTALLSLLGVPASSHKHIHSLDEIELLLAESKDGGLLEHGEHERLHHAIELSQETAKQIMTPRTKLTALNIDASIDDYYNLAMDNPFTRVLVYGDTIDDVRGIVNVKDIVFARVNGKAEDGIAPLVKPLPIVPGNLSMERLMKELKNSRSHAALVMDEHGGTLGLVTVGDILGELMEETEIDEFKREIKFEILEDERVCLSGAYKIKRALKFLGDIPETDADTINGLVIETLGRVPERGEILELQDVSLEVEEVEHNAVTSVIVTKKIKGNE